MRRLKSRGEMRNSKRTFAVILICIAICLSLGILSVIIFMADKISFEELVTSFVIFFTFLLAELVIIARIIKTVNRE